MAIIDLEERLIKIQREYDEIKAKNFWIFYLNGLKEERDKAIDHCIKDKGEIVFYQGQIRMLDNILALPEKIIDALRSKAKK